ncbi:CopG family transcriptional regulator [Leptospira dzoumogneensis]|uniref:CopG family transcriptional regulator n=1 Tax=Leptospira dzoumogneensis TaxID=2484904 RepID=A0A4Z1ANJ4_9LEPT|nr:CopG family transcriptional regulator [Leptospira dzoumogneensis]TGN02989.1 CopG family transcriptional regulator [Leptospira dzoumogneensis]
MSKTITLRIEDPIYDIFKKAADGERRTISNFVENAAIQYLTNEFYASDEEMDEILSDKQLITSLKKGMKEVAQGKYKVVR